MSDSDKKPPKKLPDFSPEQRKALSDRMRAYNATKQETLETKKKRGAAIRAYWAALPLDAPERKIRAERAKQVFDNTSPQERKRRSERMAKLHAEGKIPRTRPSRRVVPILPKKEKVRHGLSPEERQRRAERMRQMRADGTITVTMTSRLGRPNKPKRDPNAPRPSMSMEARAAISKRMKANNPMRNPETAARVGATKRQRWREATYHELEHQAGYGPNKAEATLLALIEPLGFRYTGDGSFWIGPCASGKRRNPDFIRQSGRMKTAVLYHGRYWHARSDADDAEELADYSAASWNVFVVLEHELTSDDLVKKVSGWLASLPSNKPV